MTLKRQLKIGTKVEAREHRVNKRYGRKIAKDHLKEHPKYYTKLRKCGL